MPIRSKDNQYKGINAHLHSHFQTEGGWSGFHGMHITHLAEAINEDLPTSYLVDVEQSLQIREFHPDTGERIRRPQPDITVYESRTSSSESPSTTSGTVATLTQPLAETVEVNEDLYYTALVIYRVEDDASLGRPITRIELLSPSNKFGDGYAQYREKRIATLRSEMILVEMDYLHETPPVVKGVPSYADRESGAYPYNITISDPTPSFDEGTAKTYAFGIDEPIPMLDIPLLKSDSVTVDFNVVYNRTFGSLGAYSQRVDYEALPHNFESYAENDQKKIKQRMELVRSHSQNK